MLNGDDGRGAICDGISFALGFTAIPARLGRVATPDELVELNADVCPDAGYTCP
jgi:hypothetical protein